MWPSQATWACARPWNLWTGNSIGEDLRGDTIQFVKTCPTCQIMKSDSRAKAGLLKPLEIPSRKWAHVSMNLVTDLPESNGFMAIVVFIDKLTKILHLAGCKKEVPAMEYA